MSTPTTTRRAQEIALEQIEVGGNVRELDAEHDSALAGSMAVRGLIVPVAVRPLDGDRFALVAGEHRLAAARELGWPMISDDSEGTSGDQGAESVLRKTLTPPVRGRHSTSRGLMPVVPFGVELVAGEGDRGDLGVWNPDLVGVGALVERQLVVRVGSARAGAQRASGPRSAGPLADCSIRRSSS